MKSLKGTLILLLTAFIWGTAFVAQTSASGTVSAFTFNAARSVIAAIFLGAVLLVRAAFRRIKGVRPERKAFGKSELVGGAIIGALLFAAANLQQAGIEAYPAGAAASGRAGFLTATYVVMVAVIAVFTGKKLHPTVIVAAVGCVAGMYMLCLSGGIDRVYFGDLLILLCAVGYAAYIMAVDRFNDTDGIAMSFVQFIVCSVLSTVCAFIFEQPDFGVIAQAWLPVAYAGVLSSGVAYTLQIIGQKYAEPTVATIVMSLESVFAALAGWVLLNERLSPAELAGCALVFASVILAQAPSFFKKKAA